MKCFKKVAALLFCVALALSVMSVAAFADDEAVLLEGLAEPVPNAAFTVTLEKVDPVTGNDNFTNIDATMTTNILDRDYNDTNNDNASRKGYEIKKDNDVTFAIKLAYSGSTFTPYNSNSNSGDTINGFQFTYDPGTNTDTTGNKGVTISGLYIGGQNVLTMKSTDSQYANYANVYAFGALGNGANDIPMPGNEAAIIGAITFSFDTAAQAQALTPTIKTMLIQVRGEQHPQWIVKAGDNSVPATGGTAEYPYGLTNYVTSGNPGSGFTAPTADGLSGYEDGTASTYPIWVNPYYEITVNHFKANATTGVAEVVTDTNDSKKPSTVKYYFDQTNIPDDDSATANKLTNEDEIPGYTFQGWMVTENSTSSATWDAYVATDGNWDAQTSYKQRVTASTLTDAMKTAKSWVAWDAKNEANPNVAFVDIATRESNITETPSGNGVAGVKFIPKASSGNAVTITTGYVGPITLTPVYTRNAYTVTFNADDFTKNTNSKASFAAAGTTAVQNRTDYYTIEDLANESNAAVDYLKIAYTEGTAPFIVTNGGNSALNKPGYKFVGWVPSNGTVADEDKTVITDGNVTKAGYDWTTDSTTRVNQTAVIRNNTGASGTPNQMKRYGDLTLTAEWELDIYFAKLEYWFGGEENVLALIAVPNANRIENYTYNYTKDATNYAMFEIKNETGKGNLQRAAYMTAAIAAQSTGNDATGDSANTITTELFGEGKSYNSADSYKLFAYIVPNDTKEKDFTLDESTSATGNTDIDYNGDVDGSNFVSVADFGNVDTLLLDATTNGTGDIFAITSREGVKARLKADMSTDNDNGDVKNNEGEFIRKFASIADVKAIYGAMGFNSPVTPVTPVSG